MRTQNGTLLARKDTALTHTQQTLDDIQEFVGGEYVE